MWKKKAGILSFCVIAFIIIGFCIYGVYRLRHPYVFYNRKEAGKETQQILDTFYSRKGISKGKLFDISYDHFTSGTNYHITLVKKVKNTIPDLHITMTAIQPDGSKNVIISKEPLTKALQEINKGLPNEYILYGGSGLILLNADKREQQQDMTKHLVLDIEYRGGKETHQLFAQ